MSVRITGWKGGGFMVDIRVRFSSGEKFRERRVYKMSRTAAERAAGKRHQFLLDNDSAALPSTEKVVTLAEFWPRYEELYIVADGLKATTVQAKSKTWRNYLQPVLGAKRLDDIGAAEVQALKAFMAEKELAPKTVNNALSDLSSILTKAVEWGAGIRALPAIDSLDDETREMEFFEPAELEKLLAAARRSSEDAELVVLLGADAGMRAGEMVALEWGDLDFVRREVRIRRGETIRGEVTSTKGNRERRVPMTGRLHDALKAFRHLRGERVFMMDDGKNVALWWTRDRLESAQKIAGFAKATGSVHILRHTFCSILAMRGVAPKVIQNLAGHASLTTTMRYMHLAPGGEQFRDAISALEFVETGATAGQRAAKEKGPR